MCNDLEQLNEKNQTVNEVPDAGDSAKKTMIITRPTSLYDQLEIVDALMATGSVMVDLSGVEREVGQRILDFISGAVYYGDGNISRVGQHTFYLTRTWQGNTILETQEVE